MEKIYAVVENYHFDFDNETKTSLYSTKEKAISHFNSIVEREKKDSWIATKRNVIEESREGYYDAYVEGWASEFETEISIEEKEVW